MPCRWRWSSIFAVSAGEKQVFDKLPAKVREFIELDVREYGAAGLLGKPVRATLPLVGHKKRVRLFLVFF
jgi:hypothetical protein